MVPFRIRVFLLVLATSALFIFVLYASSEVSRDPQRLNWKPAVHLPSVLTGTLSSNANQCDANVTKRFECRNQVFRNICSKESARGNVSLVTGYAPANVSLCVVPKAACTRWLGLFKYLANKNSSNKTLSSYSKYDIHDGPGEAYVRYDYAGVDKDYIRRTVRVMTTRDPYARLWSAYVDKLWLPSFWLVKGTQIIETVRYNPTQLSKVCGHDVTFSEFLQYVINTGHSMEFWDFDYHWLPVTDICNPCEFSPHFIMQQETFIPDFKFILNKVGLLDIVAPTLTADQDEVEIANEIDYAFRMHATVESCITKRDLVRRIWTAMIFNGYLHPEDIFPNKVSEESLVVSSVVKLVVQSRRNRHSNSSTKHSNRQQVLRAVYSQVPSQQLNAIRQLYRLDFEMFGYNSTPPI